MQLTLLHAFFALATAGKFHSPSRTLSVDTANLVNVPGPCIQTDVSVDCCAPRCPCPTDIFNASPQDSRSPRAWLLAADPKSKAPKCHDKKVVGSSDDKPRGASGASGRGGTRICFRCVAPCSTNLNGCPQLHIQFKSR